MSFEPDDIPEVPRLLKASQVAELFGVHPKTVYAWIKAGKLTAIRTPLGGIRIATEQVMVHLAPLPKEPLNTP
jgi:excisionase family DNA binding protein